MKFKDFVWDYMPEFVEALKAQLESDQKRWGNTWKGRLREKQETRIFAHFDDYFDKWKNAGVSIPWLKVAGLAMIAWIREQEKDNV